jgi:general stress protein YciG
MENKTVVANSEFSVEQVVRKPRGFAAMDRAKVQEIASKGGKAAHAMGVAHTFDSNEARAAGKKGGLAPHVRRGRGPVNKEKTGGLVATDEKAA